MAVTVRPEIERASGPHRPLVLVAEDSVDMRSLLTEVLESEGCDVVAVSSGSRALSAMSERPPDLVITDLFMPGMSGFALRALMLKRHDLAAIPVIVLSAYWHRPSETLEVADVITKPINIDRLIESEPSVLIGGSRDVAPRRRGWVPKELCATRANLQRGHPVDVPGGSVHWLPPSARVPGRAPKCSRHASSSSSPATGAGTKDAFRATDRTVGWRNAMARFVKEHGLSLVLAFLFIGSWLLQSVTGWVEFVSEQQAHGEAAQLWGSSGYFWNWMQATFENWQSEFLQLFAMVVLTTFLIHKGSSESRDGDEEMRIAILRIEERLIDMDERSGAK